MYNPLLQVAHSYEAKTHQKLGERHAAESSAGGHRDGLFQPGVPLIPRPYRTLRSARSSRRQGCTTVAQRVRKPISWRLRCNRPSLWAVIPFHPIFARNASAMPFDCPLINEPDTYDKWSPLICYTGTQWPGPPSWSLRTGEPRVQVVVVLHNAHMYHSGDTPFSWTQGRPRDVLLWWQPQCMCSPGCHQRLVLGPDLVDRTSAPIWLLFRVEHARSNHILGHICPRSLIFWLAPLVLVNDHCVRAEAGLVVLSGRV